MSSSPADDSETRAAAPEVITRPNGKPYRPRKVNCHAVHDDQGCLMAVIVFGTHDPERARSLAESSVQLWLDHGYTAANPQPGWWRDGMNHGERWWVYDPVRGRAGVRFEAVEATP